MQLSLLPILFLLLYLQDKISATVLKENDCSLNYIFFFSVAEILISFRYTLYSKC